MKSKPLSAEVITALAGIKALGLRDRLEEQFIWVGQKGRAAKSESENPATSRGGFWSMRAEIRKGWLSQQQMVVP